MVIESVQHLNFANKVLLDLTIPKNFPPQNQ
jgi:hypothetical protein